MQADALKPHSAGSFAGWLLRKVALRFEVVNQELFDEARNGAPIVTRRNLRSFLQPRLYSKI